jgi:hypothetical protein
MDVFFFRRCRAKYRNPWQLMDSVAVSSAMVLAWLSTQVTMRGTVWTMRVLRLFAPEVDMGGVCSLTEEALFWGPSSTKFADAEAHCVFTCAARGFQKIANRVLGPESCILLDSIRRGVT